MNRFDQMEEMPVGARAERPTVEARTRNIRSHTKQAATRVNVMRAVELPTHGPSDAAKAVSSSIGGNASIPKAHGPLIVPREVVAQFVKVDERDYYFQSGGHAFRHHKDRLTTRSENAQLVAALVSILETNGARAIAVSGTQQFRRRAWRAAVSSGLSVEGYTPTAFEKAKYLVAASAMTPQPASTSPAENTVHLANRKAASGELIIGELLDHGRAREGSDAKAPMSYYARLDTNTGERTVWGRDLERAFAAARTQPQIGNTIGVRILARDQLLIQPTPLPSLGTAPDVPRVPAKDPTFIVEKREFFATRAAAATILRDHDIPSEKGVARYPELAGAYALLSVAVRALERDVRHPADRFLFLASMREQLALHLEQGESLPTLAGLARSARAHAQDAHNQPPKLREPRVRE